MKFVDFKFDLPLSIRPVEMSFSEKILHNFSEIAVRDGENEIYVSMSKKPSVDGHIPEKVSIRMSSAEVNSYMCNVENRLVLFTKINAIVICLF